MIADEIYREVILDHHKHPRGVAPLDAYNASSSGMNPSCGDEVEIRLRIEGDTVRDVQVASRGCAVSTAAGSMLAEQVKGRDVNTLRALAADLREMLKTGELPASEHLGDFEALAGVSRFPVRVKCAMLPIAAMAQALEAYASSGKAEATGVSTEEATQT